MSSLNNFTMSAQNTISKAVVLQGVVRIQIEARPGTPVSLHFTREITVVDSETGALLVSKPDGARLLDNPPAEVAAAVELLQEFGAAEIDKANAPKE